MVCMDCGAAAYFPVALVGSQELWRCDCGKQEMRPRRQLRGCVTRSGGVAQRVHEVAGTITPTDKPVAFKVPGWHH